VQKDCLRLAHDGGADLGGTALVRALESFGTTFVRVTSLNGATFLGPGRHHTPLV